MVLSIIIVNYNTKSLLENCLNAIYSNLPAKKVEIIVVDNASKDGSIEMIKKKFPKVLLIANSKNLGFSRANNRGIKISKAEYILLLNSDTEVIGRALDLLIEFLDENSWVDICGCKLLSEDGSVERSAQTFPTLSREIVHAFPIFKRLYRYGGKVVNTIFHLFLKVFKIQWASFIDYNRTTEVDVVTGAALMFRSSLISKIGLLDENYFMYVEEADLCYRLKKFGGKVCYYPKAQIVHLRGRSLNQITKEGDWLPTELLVERYRSMFYFFKKHYNRKKLNLLRIITIAGFLTRIGINNFRSLFYSEKEFQWIICIYKRIINLAISYNWKD